MAKQKQVESMRVVLAPHVSEVADLCKAIIEREADRRSLNRIDLAQNVAMAMLLKAHEARLGK